MNPLTQSKNTTILPVLIVLTLACFALSPQARATCQDACLTNFNTAQGDDALISLTSGFGNTAIGFNALFSNTSGGSNTATGDGALAFNTTGSNNTATGVDALVSNNGSDNTASGFAALEDNRTGGNNTATGSFALQNNTTGSNNTASGFQALYSNTTGGTNTAIGVNALLNNTTGNTNTATGVGALEFNTTGIDNTASGNSALLANTTGGSNTASGVDALDFNTTGSNNTAIGVTALQKSTTGSNNVACGMNALQNNTTGGSNIAVGASAGINLTTGNNNIDLGNKGTAGESNTIRIGKNGTQTATFIAGISGATVAGGVGVIIDTNGHLGTVVSSERFKDAVKPMDKASEAILALKPVTFHYKKELDPEGIPQFGLVAEQVEKINPGLVARDEQGKPYTVRYEAVNAMLLNEFLKEHRKVEQLEATLMQQQHDFQKEVQALTTRLNAQESQLRRVGEQVQESKLARQLVADSQ